MLLSINFKINELDKSVNVFYRLYKHILSANYKNSECYNYPLYRSFRKYGLNNFEFDVLELCKKAELNKKELDYIKL